MTKEELHAGRLLYAQLKQRLRIKDLLEGGTAWMQLLDEPEVLGNALYAAMSITDERVERWNTQRTRNMANWYQNHKQKCNEKQKARRHAKAAGAGN